MTHSNFLIESENPKVQGTDLLSPVLLCNAVTQRCSTTVLSRIFGWTVYDSSLDKIDESLNDVGKENFRNEGTEGTLQRQDR